MIKRLLQSKFASQTIWALGGQVAFLMANFLLFVILVNQVPKEVYGTWALYITFISIADSIRQGMVQNGLSRLMVAYPTNLSLKSTGTALNFTIVVILGLLLAFVPSLFTKDQALIEILRHAWKGLVVLGSLLFIATFCQAKQKFKTYFLVNLIYFITFVTVLLIVRFTADQISLVDIVNIQTVSLLPAVIYYLYVAKLHFTAPKKRHIIQLFHFGKYATGTNLLSMLFHKADIIMIAYFLDPASIALYHFATKIMNYAELPLHALSQVIYPRITASFRSGNIAQLKNEYGMSLMRLLMFVVPISIVLMILNKTVVHVMADENYIEAAPLIALLAIGMMFKPLGRVFGLTLDAMGKPGINLYMLVASFVVNVVMNIILIPSFGVTGAAVATSASIILTISIGQISMKKHSPVRPLKDLTQAIKFQLKLRQKMKKKTIVQNEVIFN